jgi:tetratricopeptide (TPR) repeat protein
VPTAEERPPPPEEARAELDRSSRRRRRRFSEEAPAAVAGTDQRLPGLLLAVVVAGSVLAIGGLHLPVLLIVALLSFAAAALALHRQATTHTGLVIPVPTIIFAALAAFTLLQIIPLPMRWLTAIAPATADVWQRCLMPFGAPGPSSAPISLDPGASTVEILKWSVYAAVFAASSTIAARHGAAWGIAMVFGAAVAAALVTLGHGLAGATSVYGLYQPTFRAVAWHVGPLLNPNNLAGYLNLGALCGLGLMLAHRPLLPRWLLGLGVALIVGIEVTSASRGGVIALMLGFVALAAFTRRRDDRTPLSQSRTLWMLLAAVAGGALFAILGGTEKAWTELYDKNLQKIEMITWARPLIRDHAWFGVGRGAFESVFPVYRTTPGNVVYTHAESFPAQWIAEWGLPIGLAALGVCAWAFAPRRLGATHSALAAGAWCGVAVLLLQNVVDLALEVPAVTIGAAVVLGSLWGDARKHRPREGWRSGGPLSEGRARAFAIAVFALGLAPSGATIAYGAHDVASERTSVREALDVAFPKGRAPDPAPLRAKLRAAMLRHPAEPYFPLVGAMAAFRARDESPIPWLQRTLERGQVNGRAHLLLAEVLAARGTRKQALLELRLAMENDGSLAESVAQLALRYSRSFEELTAAAPEGKDGGRVLAIMGAILHELEANGKATAEEIDLRGRLDREAIERDPKNIAPHQREAEVRLLAMTKSTTAPICVDRDHCRAEVLAHADAIEAAEPESPAPAILRARALVADGKPEEAVRMLEKACERVTPRTVCLHERVRAAALVRAPAMLDAASKDMLGAACVTNVECAATASWLADLRLGRNEAGIAIGLLNRAAREDSANDARWFKLAEVASQNGAHMQAAEALEKVARRRGGADPALKQRIEAERAQALGGVMQQR